MDCFCHSGLPYLECCADYHEERQLPKSALVLMRSRFSAYARGLTSYLVNTTHPEHPLRLLERHKWIESIKYFCEMTKFQGLDIITFIEGDQEAFVTFRAHLIQHGEDASFTENSRFLKENNCWLYRSGHKKNQ